METDVGKAPSKVAVFTDDEIVDNANRGVGLAAPFVAQHEGFRPGAYYDKIGKKWTVGHGHTYIRDAKTGKLRPVAQGDKMDEKTSLNLIEGRLRRNAAWINKNLPWARNLKPNQLAALYDIAFNARPAALSSAKSPGLNREMSIPEADYDAILRKHIPTYKKSNGKVVQGLLNRRNDAVSAFLPVSRKVAARPQSSSAVKQASKKDTHGESGEEWTGFDLDGTLATYDEWKGVDHIGKPIKPMVDLIKKLHREGKPVKIMTARVAPKTFEDGGKGIDFVEDKNGKKKYAFEFVADWCKKNLGFTPPIVHEKDHCMGELYDDRAKQVEQNTGKVLEDSLKEARTCIKGLLKVIGKMAN